MDRFTSVARTGTGPTAPSPSVSVKVIDPVTLVVGADATLFTDELGQNPLSNPFAGANNGVVTFCAANGLYQVIITYADLTTTIRAKLIDVAGVLEEVQTALAAAASNLSTVTEITTLRTLGLADRNKYIRTTHNSAVSIVIPTNASTEFPVNSMISGIQMGNGQITFSGGGAPGDVIINTAESKKTRKKGSTWSLIKVGENEWDLTGDLELA